MPSVPTAPTISPAVSSTTQLNLFRDAINFALGVPLAQMRQTVAQTLANNTWTAITFTTEDVDTDVDGTGGHSTSSNTSRFTARYPGWYQCSGAVGFAANTTSIRGARWAVNGVTMDPGGVILNTTSTSFAVVPAATLVFYLTIGDYVELQGLQVSGGNLDTSVTSSVQSAMVVKWVRQ